MFRNESFSSESVLRELFDSSENKVAQKKMAEELIWNQTTRHWQKKSNLWWPGRFRLCTWAFCGRRVSSAIWSSSLSSSSSRPLSSADHRGVVCTVCETSRKLCGQSPHCECARKKSVSKSSRSKKAVKMGRNLVFGCFHLFFSFFLFTQTQLPEMLIGLGRVIYLIEALSVVIRTFKKFQKISHCRENCFKLFEFLSKLEQAGLWV